MNGATYSITRMYQDSNIEKEVIDTGLSLEDAKEHCKDPETSSRTCEEPENTARTDACGAWFDGYNEE